MKLIHQPSLRRVEYLPTSLEDYSFLGSFPGLVKVDGCYYSSDKAPVVRNILSRVPEKHLKKWIIPPELSAKKPLVEITDFRFFTTPLEHQMIALRFLVTNRGGGLLLDPGLGKTKVCLDLCAYLKVQRALIVCPKALMFVWEDEVHIHRPDLSYTTFSTTEWSKHADTSKQLWIINYRKAVMLKEELNRVKFDAIFIDEGLVKNPSSEQTEALTLLSRKIPVRVIMSGTLVNNSEIDVFAPVRILEPSLVGTSYAKFRDTYFKVWSPKKDGEETKVKVVSSAKDPDMIKDILHSCSLVMRKEEWLDLPEKVFKEVTVKLPSEAAHHYEEMLSNYITRLPSGELVECDNPLSVMCKLAQISSGFLYLKDDALSDLCLPEKRRSRKAKSRPVHYFQEQPKLDALQNLLEGPLQRRKFVLWYVMDAERKLLETLLERLGVAFTTIAGGEKNVREKVHRFNDPNSGLQVLVCQAKTLNYGVTLLGNQDETEEEDDLQAGMSLALNPAICDEVFFSLTFSLEVFLQQQDRIHRIGQVYTCTYWMIVSDSPTEQGLLEKLRNKMELRNFVLEDILSSARDSFKYRV